MWMRSLARCAWIIGLVLIGGVAPTAWPAPAVDARSNPLPQTNTVFAPADYPALAAWKARRTILQAQVRFAAGALADLPHPPPKALFLGRLERDGYLIENVALETGPGIYVTGNLYRPDHPPGKVPAVACPHGHWQNGRLQQDVSCSVPARCAMLARMGMVAFAYDMVGYNDAGLTFHHRDPHFDTPETALWGIGHLAMQTANSARVVDFLQSLPEVDPQRVGVTGASGGGTQSFILAAVDDRVAVSCPVNMISSTMQGGCVCENAPLLRIDTNNMEIAALCAPRPMLMVSASGDWTTRTPEVEFPFVRSIYRLYGHPERVANAHFQANHNYHQGSREAMYGFFAKWLLVRGDGDPIHEDQLPTEKVEELRVFSDTNRPDDLATAEQVVAYYTAALRERNAGMAPTTAEKLSKLCNAVRDGLSCMIASGYPSADEIRRGPAAHMDETTGGGHTETLERRGRFVQQRAFPPAGQPARGTVLCVDPDGLAGAATHGGLLQRLQGDRWQVIFVEPFGTGEARRPPSTQPATPFFTTFNRTDAAEAVYDILTALAATQSPTENKSAHLSSSSVRVRLLGFGRMGPICMVARAMVPREGIARMDLRAIIDMNALDGNSDATCVSELFIPHLQRIGGLRAIAAVAATDGTNWFHNTGGKLPTEWIDQAKTLRGSSVTVIEDAAPDETIAQWVTLDK